MSWAWTGLLICVWAAFANVATQFVTYRLTQNYVRSILAGFAAGLLVLLVLETVRFAGPSVPNLTAAWLIVGDLALFGSSAFIFFNFLNVPECSVRYRILREFLSSSEPIREADLLKIYNEDALLAVRLRRMLTYRQMRLEGGRYRIASQSLRRTTALVRWIKRIMLGRTGQFIQ